MSVAAISTVATIASTVVGTIGSVMSGEAQSAAASYNAKIQQQNAKWASEAGDQQAAIESQKTRARVGEIKAAQGANNIEVDSGSAPDVRSSASELGELSALTIRSNAAKQAYGYQAQANLDQQNAQMSEMAGMVGGLGTLIGGAGQAATNWENWSLSGGLV